MKIKSLVDELFDFENFSKCPSLIKSKIHESGHNSRTGGRKIINTGYLDSSR